MARPKNPFPFLASTHKVWDKAPHSGFTDLIRHKDVYYLAFREAEAHQFSNNGVIRILRSPDGLTFEPFLLVEEEGIDLRDPHFSVMPDGRLHLMMGGLKLDQEGKIIHTGTKVAIFNEAMELEPLITPLELNEWLWRIDWYQGVGYGVSYRYDHEEPYAVSLFKTLDGERFEKLRTFDIHEWPNETTTRFDKNGTMHLLVRRGIDWKTTALLGESKPPYDTFKWFDTGFSLGGPDFLIMDDGKLWITARLIYGTPYGLFALTALLLKSGDDLFRKIYFPSFGDTGYPGMSYQNGELLVSYYSTHHEKTAIYISKVLLGQ
ncbi:MAG: hypothetical protein KDK62_04765 [Chlamydiia bacterium]|nr:hypothetical protein [Chlamydiia bacterium]